LAQLAGLDRDWSWLAAREASLQHVTLAQLDEAWRRRMKDGRFMVTTAGDFKAPQAIAH